jgi:hypothetical protein
MSTTRGRGRAIKVGGMAIDLGASGRTESPPHNNLTRPAYMTAQGFQSPAPPAAVGGGGHPLLDLSTVAGWRLVFVGVALAYVVGFHVTLGRTRLGLGPR